VKCLCKADCFIEISNSAAVVLLVLYCMCRLLSNSSTLMQHLGLTSKYYYALSPTMALCSFHTPITHCNNRNAAFSKLAECLPRVVAALDLRDDAKWQRWSQSPECERDFPPTVRISAFQKVLVVQVSLLQNNIRSYQERCTLFNKHCISTAVAHSHSF
jgi:hypothetical protein